MKKTYLVLAFMALATASVAGQDCGNTNVPGPGCGGVAGPITATCGPYPRHFETAVLAHGDRYHPAPHYAYGRGGVDATRMNAWNQQQAAIYPWHGNYSYWRFGVPTALVVPPTSAFQSEYNWGVAQTKSLPIYHQFGRTYTETAGGGFYPPHPYWPSSTNQFGIYPVRAPY